MHRVDTDGHVLNMFDEGDPLIPRLPTEVDSEILNAFQEELANAIEADGTALVKGTNTQLRSILAAILANTPPGGRLTLTTALPVTTSDVTGATTVRYTPYMSNKIALYNGTRWVLYTFTELSQATTDATKSPAAVANNSNYDVFVWSDSGTLRATRGPAWTSDSARGTGAGTTELELYEGRYVNKVAVTNGPAARCGLYVGTIRSDGSAQINDSEAKRHVWNTFNRVTRPMRIFENNVTWNYSVAGGIRQVNANTANQLDVVIGLAEDEIDVQAFATVQSTNTNDTASTGIGVDSTTTNSAFLNSTPTLASVENPQSFYRAIPAIGRHFYVWLERAGGAAGTLTWTGVNGIYVRSGMYGSVRA